jgi:plasmid stability protein
MRTRITIRIAEQLRTALKERAALQDKTVSEVAREILSEAVSERRLGSRIGHLRGRLELPRDGSNRWRKQLRQRNWRA